MATISDTLQAHPCPTCDGTGRVGHVPAGVAALDGTTDRTISLCSRQWWKGDAQHFCDRPRLHEGRCASSRSIAPDGPVPR